MSGIAKVLVAFGGAFFGLAILAILGAMSGSAQDPHGGVYLLVVASILLALAFAFALIGYAIHRYRQSRRSPPP